MRNLYQTLTLFAMILTACAPAILSTPSTVTPKAPLPTLTATNNTLLLSQNSPQQFTWTEKASMPVSARNGAAVLAGDKIYFMGGSGLLKKNYEYTPASDTWTKRKDMLTDGWNIAPCFFENKIYVFGGDPFRDRSEVYDIQTDSWKKLQPLPTARQHVKCAVVGEKIYVIGGLEKGQVVSGKNERYDPQTDTWQAFSPMPIPMHSPHAYVIVMGSLVYVMGGMGDSNSIWSELKTLEVYNTETDTWEVKRDLPFPSFIGAAVIDDKLYALGHDSSEKGMLAVYLVAEDTWKILGDIPVVRWQAGITGFNHSIFIIGGNDSDFTPYATVYEIILK
jgi:N-acetylneuraminic acid mutarotase